MIFVSAGFDAHWDEPITALGLSSAGFFALAQRLVELAGEYCNGRLVFALEGGYNPQNVAAGVEACLSAMTGAEFRARDPSSYREPEIGARLAQLREWHKSGVDFQSPPHFPLYC
jgi:acetoin utilization deacetylase AcuC-like enzyme